MTTGGASAVIRHQHAWQALHDGVLEWCVARAAGVQGLISSAADLPQSVWEHAGPGTAQDFCETLLNRLARTRAPVIWWRPACEALSQQAASRWLRAAGLRTVHRVQAFAWRPATDPAPGLCLDPGLGPARAAAAPSAPVPSMLALRITYPRAEVADWPFHPLVGPLTTARRRRRMRVLAEVLARSPTTHHAVLWADDQPVGCGLLHVTAAPETGGTAGLHDFAILPAWQGRGLGRRLLGALGERALAASAEVVVLVAEPTAERFYRALGLSTCAAFHGLTWSGVARRRYLRGAAS